MGATASCRSFLPRRQQESGCTQFIRAVTRSLGPGLGSAPEVLAPLVQVWPGRQAGESHAQVGLTVL